MSVWVGVLLLLLLPAARLASRAVRCGAVRQGRQCDGNLSNAVACVLVNNNNVAAAAAAAACCGDLFLFLWFANAFSQLS